MKQIILNYFGWKTFLIIFSENLNVICRQAFYHHKIVFLERRVSFSVFEKRNLKINKDSRFTGIIVVDTLGNYLSEIKCIFSASEFKVLCLIEQ